MDCHDILRQYAKTIMMIFDLFFLMLGSLLIALSSTLKVYYHEYEQVFDSKYLYAADFVMVVGILIFCMSIFDCFGRALDHPCMLACFSFFMVVVLIFEALVIVAAVLMRTQAEETIHQALNATIVEYGHGNFNLTTDIWDKVQNQLGCCGIADYRDWAANNLTGQALPISCCHIPSGTINNFTCTPMGVGFQTEGCLTKLVDYAQGGTTTLMAFGIPIVLLHLLVIASSCYLSRMARSEYETV